MFTKLHTLSGKTVYVNLNNVAHMRTRLNGAGTLITFVTMAGSVNAVSCVLETSALDLEVQESLDDVFARKVF
jgi:hypothetical protein